MSTRNAADKSGKRRAVLSRTDGRNKLRLCRRHLTVCMNSIESSRARHLHSDEQGQAMVEIALVLPVLLLVVTGILTFGLAWNNYVTLTEATNVGARALAISRGATTDPCAVAANAVIAAAPLLNSSNLS